MGRRNKSYAKDLHQQAYDKLIQMQAFGESKKEARKNGTDKDKIFSFNTYHTYWQHIKYFLRYVQVTHPDCSTLRSAKKYVNEWLQSRVDEGKSAWTVQTEAKALGKLYGIQPEDKDYFTPPKRNRKDIKRSRVDVTMDSHFSETNNDELIKFCKGTGLRRRELEMLRGKDIVSKEQIERGILRLQTKSEQGISERERTQLVLLMDTRLFDNDYFMYVCNGKGGRERFSPIIGKYQEQIVARMKNTDKEDRVWKYVSKNADIHGYRSDYATEIYRTYARKIDEIPYDKINQGTGKRYQSDVYTCRKDEAGKKLDKKAMLLCSKALGHNRISIVADNYIRGI